MKKVIIVGLIGTCTAGLAMAAEESAPWYKKLFGKSGDDQAAVIAPVQEEMPAPVATPEKPLMPQREGLSETQRPKLTPEQIEKMKARREQMMKQREGEGPADRPHPQMNPQQMEKMKAQRDAIMQLGEAARNETDPVKKEALVAELRAKLTEVSDRIHEEAKKRLAQIGKETKGLEKRIADYENNKSARVEEQVQRILAGEPLRGPDGKHSEGGFKKEGKKPKAPVEE